MTLRVSDLSCQRGGRLVLDRISFDLPQGQTLLLRGPNGAGKTTLLRVLAGLIRRFDGDLRFGELSPREDRDAWAGQIGYIGHLDAIKPQLTLVQNLRFWAALGGCDPGEALSRFGLGHLALRPAHACSAGQRRRAGLARLLLVPCPLWLLDEPATALDSAATATLESLIDSHNATGGVAVVATHQPLKLRAATELVLAPATGTAGPFLEPAQ